MRLQPASAPTHQRLQGGQRQWMCHHGSASSRHRAIRASANPSRLSTGTSISDSVVRRGVLILPGLGNNAADYGPLKSLLEARGMAVEIAQVSRLDWSRNAAALTDPNWWRGTLQPRPAVDWYLQRVDGAMQRLKRRVEAAEAPISMLTHSAGGWLGRVYLRHWGTAGVDRYVSLGSPHTPPPQGAKGVVDQTRGILTAINDATPGAFHSSIRYVTIAGKFVHGAPLLGPSSPAAAAATGAVAAAAAGTAGAAAAGAAPAAAVEAALTRTAQAAAASGAGGSGAAAATRNVAAGTDGTAEGRGAGSGLLARIAGAGYQQVCGDAEVWGDFIVPQPAAHLAGAAQLDLEGVFHSPLGAQLPFFGPWYGTEQVLDQWFHHLTGDEEEEEKVAAAAAAEVFHR